MRKNAMKTCLAILLIVASSTFAAAGSSAGEAGKQSETAQITVDPKHAGFGTVFYVNDPTGRNAVSFSSKAPLEDIIGTTGKITGYVVFDPANGTAGGRGSLTVAADSFNTGIPLRNEHLAGEGWLDAGNHPQITFKFDETRDVKLVQQSAEFQTYDAVLAGDFTLHGVTKKLEIPARFTYMKESTKTRARMQGNLIAGRAQFAVKLSDFGIAGPSGMDLIGAKVAEEIEIQVSFVATDKAPQSSAGR